MVDTNYCGLVYRKIHFFTEQFLQHFVLFSLTIKLHRKLETGKLVHLNKKGLSSKQMTLLESPALVRSFFVLPQE